MGTKYHPTIINSTALEEEDDAIKVVERRKEKDGKINRLHSFAREEGFRLIFDMIVSTIILIT